MWKNWDFVRDDVRDVVQDNRDVLWDNWDDVRDNRYIVRDNWVGLRDNWVSMLHNRVESAREASRVGRSLTEWSVECESNPKEGHVLPVLSITLSKHPLFDRNKCSENQLFL